MARAKTQQTTDDRKVTPLKDPVDRNQDALDRALDIQADLAREIARRTELEGLPDDGLAERRPSAAG